MGKQQDYVHEQHQKLVFHGWKIVPQRQEKLNNIEKKYSNSGIRMHNQIVSLHVFLFEPNLCFEGLPK